MSKTPNFKAEEIYQNYHEVTDMDRSAIKLVEWLDLYLTLEDTDQANIYLEVLISHHASPLISTFFLSKVDYYLNNPNYGFTKENADNLAVDVLIKLQKNLIKRRTYSEYNSHSPIINFDAYIKAICKYTFSDYLRTNYPEFTRLKNRIRYLLDTQGFFLTWILEGKTVCLLSNYSKTPTKFTIEKIIKKMKKTLPNYPSEELIVLVETALKFAKGWVYLTDLTKIIGNVQGLINLPSQIFEEEEKLEILAFKVEESESKHFINRYELRYYWEEICELNYNQRLAFLCKLVDEDGSEVVSSFFERGIATLDEIADVLVVERDTIEEFLVKLPLNDSEIADLLSIEDCEKSSKVKKIQNLRKTARELLKRRRDGKQKRAKHK